MVADDVSVTLADIDPLRVSEQEPEVDCDGL